MLGYHGDEGPRTGRFEGWFGTAISASCIPMGMSGVTSEGRHHLGRRTSTIQVGR
jgi:hypothetical protein